ncbi:MAG: hypothetical protein KDE58_20270, partial [Caldilineaceae bacterium]|nr:hypothetical protein [Caldilineaceae bacterium]
MAVTEIESKKSQASRPQGTNPTLGRSLLGYGSAFLLWSLLFWIAGFWQTYWWLGLTGIFVLVTMAANRVGRVVPLRHRRRYEQLLALGFPLLLLIAWEWLVRGGILNARWFPPPTRIAVALYDLTVSYDQFNETSLLGRPWLIPTR